MPVPFSLLPHPLSISEARTKCVYLYMLSMIVVDNSFGAFWKAFLTHVHGRQWFSDILGINVNDCLVKIRPVGWCK